MDVSSSATFTRTLVVRRAGTEQAPVGTGSIGDTVWRDIDADGLQDPGEPGVAGVWLSLYDDQDHHLGRAVSDANGSFSFDRLSAGMYSLGAANLPAGFVLTRAAQGGDPLIDSDSNPVTGRSSVVSLSNGQRASGLDVGLVAVSSGPTIAGGSVTAVDAATRVLPRPDVSQVAAPVESRSSAALLVLVASGLLALSILLGLIRPRLRTRTM